MNRRSCTIDRLQALTQERDQARAAFIRQRHEAAKLMMMCERMKQALQGKLPADEVLNDYDCLLKGAS